MLAHMSGCGALEGLETHEAHNSRCRALASRGLIAPIPPKELRQALEGVEKQGTVLGTTWLPNLLFCLERESTGAGESDTEKVSLLWWGG